MEKKNILILGAGLSSSSLVEYLLHAAEPHGWLVTVGDLALEAAEQKVKGHAAGRAVAFDADRAELRDAAIGAADVVISMLPARMHPTVAECCVRLGRHMITASYVSDEMRALDAAAGGKLSSFESSTGGLVAPEHDDNPWNYKFTWHPSNVVTAGQGVSRFLHNGRIKYIPYHKIFRRTELVEVLDVGAFEVYANRDSLKYKEIYGLDDIQTLFRGTMRRPGYSKAWDVFVQLGMTEQTYVLEDSEQMTYRDFLNSYLPYARNVPLETKLAGYLGIDEGSDEMQKIKWCGIFEAKKIGLPRATPARILQNLLEPKWQLGPQDLDMIVMQHVFKAEFDDIRRQLTSSLVFKGRDTTHTAMAMTVGIPVAIAAKLLLTGRIHATGVQIPITREIYEPVLAELADLGVRFVEQETVVEE
jgi:saccharopine dehydrogenase-like NADP-dependent oxidoreductase